MESLRSFHKIETAYQSAASNSRATRAYVAPFLAFVTALAVEHAIPLPATVFYPVRFAIVLVLILVFSRPYLHFQPGFPLGSIAVGLAVFVLWIAPDLLFHYRHTWLFANPVTGSAKSSLAPELKNNAGFIVLRCLSSFGLVPVLEELFWRGWMMRWLIDRRFLKVPLGTYSPFAFWMVAVLFASEHGPYWEVGLVAGIIYNWWMIRTRNLADCILAHGVTNVLLSGYVLWTDQWQYWL
jgi:CAAX prenyl protease-like protein